MQTNTFPTPIDTRRIGLFLAFAFGIAWAASLIIYLTGGLVNSPSLVEGTPITLALVLLAGPVMWSPALAHILTRWLTREGRQNLYLRINIRRTWPYWLAAWFLPALMTIFGAVVYFLLFPQHFDESLGVLSNLISANLPPEIDPTTLNPWTIAVLQTIQAVLIAPLVNSPATFGEEFGWRGYLQPKLMPLGGRIAMLWMGLIWGVWHAPIIMMGHNFGLEYPGAPFLGPLAMIWFCLTMGIFLGWMTLKSASVWPAVIGHAAINGIAGLAILFVQGQPNPLLGPLPVGVIGGLGITLVAAVIYFSPNGLQETPE
jgi:membrane protease YdiL (CAAX protease family)